jgi:hypothetical protein
MPLEDVAEMNRWCPIKSPTWPTRADVVWKKTRSPFFR